jgi:hypothetical protein
MKNIKDRQHDDLTRLPSPLKKIESNQYDMPKALHLTSKMLLAK